MYQDDLGLAHTVLDLPFVSVAVIATWLGRDRTSVARQVQRWERQGWIQSLRPPLLGQSRHRVYALTALGVRTWVPRCYPMEDLLDFAITYQLDPVGLVSCHLPALLRRQTVYWGAAQILAQLRQRFPTATFTIRTLLDHGYTVTLPGVRRKQRQRQITVASDLLLEVGVQQGSQQVWELAQVWVDDGVTALTPLQARIQRAWDAWRLDPQGTPQTHILVRDAARLGVWEAALAQVWGATPLTPCFPVQVWLISVSWPWPLGGAAANGAAQQVTGLLDRRVVSPMTTASWTTRTSPVPLFTPDRPRRMPTLPRWRQRVLEDTTRSGTLADALTMLAKRTTQQARLTVRVAEACVTWTATDWRVLLLSAWMPQVSRSDLATLVGHSWRRLTTQVHALQRAGMLDLVPGPAAGVQLTEAGRSLLHALFPAPLPVYQRMRPTRHEHGVAHLGVLLLHGYRTNATALWWWAGPDNHVRIVANGRRQTVYPDAFALLVQTMPVVSWHRVQIEWDTGTERRAAWEGKAALYARWIQGQLARPLVRERWTLLVVTSTLGAAEQIADILTATWARLGVRTQGRFGAAITTSATLERGVSEALWTTVGVTRAW